MPNIKSAKKRVLVAKVNNERNKAYRSALRTAIKKANIAVDAKADNAAEAVKVAVKEIDGAVSKGIIHKNNAARKKSGLQKRLNNMA